MVRGQTGGRFDLEVLEPRILMSTGPIAPDTGELATGNNLVQEASETAAIAAAGSEVAYDPAAQVSDIFTDASAPEPDDSPAAGAEDDAGPPESETAPAAPTDTGDENAHATQSAPMTAATAPPDLEAAARNHRARRMPIVLPNTDRDIARANGPPRRSPMCQGGVDWSLYPRTDFRLCRFRGGRSLAGRWGGLAVEDVIFQFVDEKRRGSFFPSD